MSNARQELLNVLAHHLMYIADRQGIIREEEAKTSVVTGAQSQWGHKPRLPWIRSQTQGVPVKRPVVDSRMFMPNVSDGVGDGIFSGTPWVALQKGRCKIDSLNATPKGSQLAPEPPSIELDWYTEDYVALDVCSYCKRPLGTDGSCQRCLDSFFDFDRCGGGSLEV